MSRPATARGAAAAAAVAVAATLSGACTLEPRTDQNAQARTASTSTAPVRPYREIVHPEGAPRLPMLSSAVRHGDLLFLSGQLGIVPGSSPTVLAGGGAEAETRQAFENMRSVLAAAGLDLQNLVKCTVFLADMADYGPMNTAYVSFFPADPPARSAVAVSGLALDARVEVECLGAYPPGR